MIGTLDELRESAELEVFRAADEDKSVIERIVSAQRVELEKEIGEIKDEVERIVKEARCW